MHFNITKTLANIAWHRSLILLLFIGFVVGTIVKTFEETQEKVGALAFFIPMIVGMTDNTGTIIGNSGKRTYYQGNE